MKRFKITFKSSESVITHAPSGELATLPDYWKNFGPYKTWREAFDNLDSCVEISQFRIQAGNGAGGNWMDLPNVGFNHFDNAQYYLNYMAVNDIYWTAPNDITERKKRLRIVNWDDEVVMDQVEISGVKIPLIESKISGENPPNI
jgi:hypothetical protein